MGLRPSKPTTVFLRTVRRSFDFFPQLVFLGSATQQFRYLNVEKFGARAGGIEQMAIPFISRKKRVVFRNTWQNFLKILEAHIKLTRNVKINPLRWQLIRGP